MSSQRYGRQNPDAGQTADRTRSTPASSRSHNPYAHHATTYPYPQEIPMPPLSMQPFHPYPSHLPFRATLTMAPTVSYPPMSTSIEATQQTHMHPNLYSNIAYYPSSAAVEAAPPFFSHAASQISSPIQPALAFPAGAVSTGIHHGTAYEHTARTGQFRDMSPINLYIPSSPGSPTSSSSYYQPYQPSSAHSISPSLEPIPFLPQDPVNRVPCLWHDCSVMLDDISTAGIKRHIRDWHGDLSRASQKERKTCLWDDGSVCGRELDAASFAKHIASVHLKSTAQKCEYCQNMIGRADSLARHKRDHCPDRPHC